MSLGAVKHGDRAAREVSHRAGGYVADATTLQAMTGAQRSQGMIVEKMDDHTQWVFDIDSTASASSTVLVPADSPTAGRWLAQSGFSGVAAATLAVATGDASTTPELGVPFVIRQAFTAGTPGSAGDVVIYDAAAPFKFRVLDVLAIVTTGISAKTITLRDAKAAGGNALTDAMAAATSGATVRSAATTATRTIAANGTLALRLSDIGLAGEVIITAVRET